MQRVSYDQISSILLVVVAIIALWKTRGLSEMSYIFPRTIGIILLMLSIIYLIFSYLRRENKKLFHNIDKSMVVIMGLGMIGYFVLIVICGFLIASILYIGAITLYLQKEEKHKTFNKKLMHASIFSFSISIVFYLLFKNVFLIQLPTGMFGF